MRSRGFQPQISNSRSFSGEILSGEDSQKTPPRRQRSGDSSVFLAPFGLLEPPHSMPATPVVASKTPDPKDEMTAPLLFGHDGDPADARSNGNCAVGTPQAADLPLETRWVRFTQKARQLLAFTGPGWLMSVAYVDPGNLEADLQCGAQFGYILLWVLFWATSVGLCLQLVAARLGCATREHLAEHCRDHYTPFMRVVLWLITELAIIGSDIQEVIGCSIGLQLLFGLPLAAGVVLTAFAAFGFLFLERLGTRPLELFFGMLILVLAITMFFLFYSVKPETDAVLEGLLIPRLPASAMKQAVGMVGCIIMPHNIFLHSALVQSRVVEPGQEAEAVWLFTIESTAAIFTSVLINVAVIAIFAKGFYGSEDSDIIGLRNAGGFLGDAFGDQFRIIWALGLVAAGQSSTMTGAYAGQWVMQGFLELKVVPWKRALVTRSMALLPTLAVAISFGEGENSMDVLNSYLNVLQSLVLPFALVPLLTFAGCEHIMGSLVLGRTSLRLAWSAAFLIVVANVYLFVDQFWVAVTERGTPALVGLCLGLLGYCALVVYVAWAPDMDAASRSEENPAH